MLKRSQRERKKELYSRAEYTFEALECVKRTP